MRRGKLNHSECFSPAPSQVPNEGQAKSALKTKSPNHQRTALAAQHGAGQDSSPGQAVRRRHTTNALTSNTVGEGVEAAVVAAGCCCEARSAISSRLRFAG